MRKYFCDRCGREMDRGEVTEGYFIDLDNVTIDETGDLCPDCRELIMEFIKKGET